MEKAPKARLSREIAIEVVRAADDQPETFTAALSSEAVVTRWFGNEILDHSSEAIDLSRAADGIPLLYGHTELVGRVHNLRPVSRKLRGDLRFFSTDRAQEVATMVREGHREMSVQYTIERMRLESETDDLKTYRATRWTLLEASVVAVPADGSVGVGRSADDQSREMPPVEGDPPPDPQPEPQPDPQVRAASEPAADSSPQ